MKKKIKKEENQRYCERVPERIRLGNLGSVLNFDLYLEDYCVCINTNFGACEGCKDYDRYSPHCEKKVIRDDYCQICKGKRLVPSYNFGEKIVEFLRRHLR